MKTSQQMIASGLLGCAALLAVGHVYAEDDLDLCRGGYKMLLMTPGECKGYLREIRAAQAREDFAAVLDLQGWHTELLIERSQACPCRSKPAAMHSVRMTNGGQQFAFSSWY